MPIYEYRCNKCGHEFEEWQKITDAPVSTCPSCKAQKVERLLSMSSFQLKGGGWYVTDYARKKGPSRPSDDKKAKGDKSKKSGKDSASATSTS